MNHFLGLYSMRYFIFFVLGIFSSLSFASVKVDLYHTQVTLQEGQSEHDAQIAGLENVIIKASGNTDAGNNVVVKKALSNVSRYLTELGYDKNSDNQTVVKLGFNSQNIRELLTQAQLPYWPAMRTNILVWYIVDNGQQRSIAWENMDSDVVSWLKNDAELRGLPITIPVGDFTDVMNVEVSDLWGGFLKPISQASSRYHPDAVLVIRAQSNRTRWTLYDQSADQLAADSVTPMVGSVATSGEDAVKAVIDDLTQYYAKKNGVLISTQTSESSVSVEINNIQNAIDFFTLENELKSLSSVASIDVEKVSGQSILYTVHILTTEENFEQELTKNQHLVRINDPVVDSAEPVTAVNPVNSIDAEQSTASTITAGQTITTEPDVTSAAESNSPVAEPDMAHPVSPILRYEWQ